MIDGGLTLFFFSPDASSNLLLFYLRVDVEQRHAGHGVVRLVARCLGRRPRGDAHFWRERERERERDREKQQGEGKEKKSDFFLFSSFFHFFFS